MVTVSEFAAKTARDILAENTPDALLFLATRRDLINRLECGVFAIRALRRPPLRSVLLKGLAHWRATYHNGIREKGCSWVGWLRIVTI